VHCQHVPQLTWTIAVPPEACHQYASAVEDQYLRRYTVRNDDPPVRHDIDIPDSIERHHSRLACAVGRDWCGGRGTYLNFRNRIEIPARPFRPRLHRILDYSHTSAVTYDRTDGGLQGDVRATPEPREQGNQEDRDGARGPYVVRMATSVPDGVVTFSHPRIVRLA
jgi:hypothetical protein